MAAKRSLFRQCREQIGSQALVASELKISTVYVRMIENGTFTPGRDLMFRIAQHFGKTEKELFPDYFDKIKVT
ncbi:MULTISPECIES: helix-turn-helix transcriptional regulator [unclassified Paenibacillus]|uniref:helix-turn-helix transcriptional regulator n=1 Tax=unclassified Paenibacillus TaxID=185978 RepID=UPI0009A72C99|nr:MULTISPECIES: helix-turn-helix transcriptional regulator [unclassified Paenibacillus]SLJ92782.1 DNA-binding transcriptional regulator, XRE-family HTH domain [Paenibacillus sp. RU5A]SOC58501.1 DNA-binding transcriptional regulator, XRE-family HTH domain [Paenibacillus sp. RU26A]SOC67553.1 DNA-binding transcriptional regulator, XRE-family HTH domain [Paenibacillus sp. RU5M]